MWCSRASGVRGRWGRQARCGALHTRGRLQHLAQLCPSSHAWVLASNPGLCWQQDLGLRRKPWEQDLLELRRGQQRVVQAYNVNGAPWLHARWQLHTQIHLSVGAIVWLTFRDLNRHNVISSQITLCKKSNNIFCLIIVFQTYFLKIANLGKLLFGVVILAILYFWAINTR